MADDILRGWNAISEFLSCDVRTAKRWEQTRRLPVHRTRRTPGEGRANVYALISELHAWIASANTVPELADAPLAASLSIDPLVSPDPPASSRAFLLPAALAALLLIAGVAWTARHRISVRANTARELHPPATPSPNASPAPELYLHGSYLFEQRTPETLQQAKLDFQSVIASNPTYAPAYAGLAKTYALLREYSNLPAAEAYPLVRQSAQQAIALDPNLSDAHTALGYEEFFWEWDAPRAESEFKQAIALDPNSSLAHHWYGSMLTHQRRFAEAIDELNRAQILEPDSASTLSSRAYAIGLNGNRNQAVDLLQDILTRVPDSAPLHFVLAQLCLQQPRDIPRYLDQMHQFATLRHHQQTLALIDAGAAAYRNNGEQAMWSAMLDAERRLHPDTRHPTYAIFRIEAIQGLKDDAFRDLNLLLHDHDEQLIGINIDPTLYPLSTDPRFAAIDARIGLPHPSAPANALALNR